MSNITFLTNLGPESATNEYKQFTFNYNLHNIDNELAEELVTTNEFCFSHIIKKQIVSYIKTYLPKFISAIMNSQTITPKGNLFIGVKDDGTVIGIPIQGTIDKFWLEDIVFNTIDKMLNSNYTIEWKKYINVKLISVTKPNKPQTKISEKATAYFEEKELLEKKYKTYLEQLDNWKIRMSYFTQKLTDLVNNNDSRQLLIDYIKSCDPTNPSISLLLTDWKMEPKTHEEILLLKQKNDNPYYWIVTWKDLMIENLKNSRPQFYSYYTKSVLPINLLCSVSEMVPYWMNYNLNMNLYLIHISIIQPIFKNIVSYQEPMTGKWLKVYRTIKEGHPACIRF